MIALNPYELFLIAGIATICAVSITFMALGLGGLRARFQPAKVIQSNGFSGPTFLFDDHNILDACPDAQTIIAGSPPHMTGKQAVERIFHKRFPTLGEQMDTLMQGQCTRIMPDDQGGGWLELSKTAGRTRLTICDSSLHTDTHAEASAALVAELEFLRTVAEFAPQQIWQQDAKGNVIWANHAYLAVSDSLASAQDGHSAAWPEHPIFEDLHFDIPNDQPVSRRRSLKLPNEKSETWFDVTSLNRGDTSLHFAVNANSAVVVEHARKTLLQTFGKTFASLSTGLAIFNDKRQLSIFNPALIDLTGMSVDFLSSRPTIDMFLDALREDRMLPEPKDYATWREQFNALEDAALRGVYCENWALPDGLTYRVTGKPQGDGAFAFFFEDISAEISLTRRFRSEIETGQAVLDTLPDAIAVFSNTGVLVISNASYDSLWDMADFDLMGRQDIRAEMAVWQRKCAASPIWTDLRDFISAVGDRAEWKETEVLDDGRQITCTARPITGGKTIVTFALPKKVSPRIEMLMRNDPSLRVGKR